MKQHSLFKIPSHKKFFGGSLLSGRRKGVRPIASDQALHLVLKSQWATGVNKFTTQVNRRPVTKIILEAAKRYNIRLYKIAISGNNIHLIIRAKKRWLYRAFISVITGLIAQHVMNRQSFKVFMLSKTKELAGEGVPQPEKGQAFWQHRPFSRIINWGRDYRNCLAYLTRNTLEALGFFEYKQRRDYYASWRISLGPEPNG